MGTRWKGRIAGTQGGQNDPGSTRCGCCGAQAARPNRAARRAAQREIGHVPPQIVTHFPNCPCVGGGGVR